MSRSEGVYLHAVPSGASTTLTIPAGIDLGIDDMTSVLPLRVAIHHYLAARRNDLTASSLRGIRDNLLHFARHLPEDFALHKVRRRHVEEWVAKMTCGANTIRNRLNAARGFYRWALAHEHARVDPTAGVRGPSAPQLMPREIEHERIEKLLAVLPDARAELIVFLGIEQGLRISEIAGLRRENLDTIGAMMLVYGKGKKERWLPITETTNDALRAYLAEVPGTTGPLLRSASKPGRGLSPGYISTLISRWMYEAGVKLHAWDGTSAHGLRHGMAGQMLDQGADIRDVQAALGHADLGATYIYLRRRAASTRLRQSMGQRTYRRCIA